MSVYILYNRLHRCLHQLLNCIYIVLNVSGKYYLQLSTTRPYVQFGGAVTSTMTHSCCTEFQGQPCGGSAWPQWASWSQRVFLQLRWSLEHWWMDVLVGRTSTVENSVQKRMSCRRLSDVPCVFSLLRFTFTLSSCCSHTWIDVHVSGLVVFSLGFSIGLMCIPPMCLHDFIS